MILFYKLHFNLKDDLNSIHIQHRSDRASIAFETEGVITRTWEEVYNMKI